ncbi:DUF2335 domain-containing protein [Salmonella enterica]|nr:DUF2335 domain-containing protein [Salmonella enterica]EBY9433268.1 DUF2335 domain-containing protein [Salmonella enterica subsp. enterica serovar Cerro]ECC5192448.1 DUF2335 domain-containing protein [Salmonella enterica]EEO3519585.1 DUF2335 domain-containing protein [Salmonella enterica subsp. enterica serovar Cerro]EHG4769613.1 DUF2335 domain-containing protein [Salmonella enterica]
MQKKPDSKSTSLKSTNNQTDDLVASVIENPEVLSRVLDTPKAQAIVLKHFQGPVPPPAMLKEYNDVIPGLANRLIELTEKEQSHRHSIESDNVKISKRGQIMSFFVVLIIIFAAILFGLNGNTVLAGILVGIDLAALVTAFIAGKYYSIKTTDSENE